MPIRPILSLPIPYFPIRPVCLRPFIVHFLPIEEGGFVRPSSVSLGREVCIIADLMYQPLCLSEVHVPILCSLTCTRVIVPGVAMRVQLK